MIFENIFSIIFACERQLKNNEQFEAKNTSVNMNNFDC